MRVVMCGGCTSHHPYTQIELDRILNLLNVSNPTFIEPYVPGTEWDPHTNIMGAVLWGLRA